MSNEVRELREEIEDLTTHLADVLEAALHFAGVKEESLEQAVEAYIEVLDVVFEDDDGEMGYLEIVKAIEFMKLKKPLLFVQVV